MTINANLRRAVKMHHDLIQRKDEPPRDTPEPLQLPVGATDEAPTAAKYREILVRHRRTQLQDIRANLQRMAQTYDRAAEIIAARVRALPDTVERTGTGWLAAQLNAMADIRVELERLRTDYGNLLDLSMISSAQSAADREAEVARLVGAPIDPNLYVSTERAVTLTTGEGIAVRFGTLAKEAVEGVANRYYRDGLVLSDRLWNLAEGTRMAVEDTIQAGIASGQSARNLATDIQRVMTADGVQTPRYNAMRIARTEVNNSFREAHTKSVIDRQTGGMKSYIAGIKWNLSLSHARTGPDICCRIGTMVETGEGPRPIEDVQLGDRVLTHKGRYQMVTRLYRNTIPAGSLVRLCFRVGRNRTHELTVTPNHPVLTEQGWVPAGDLQTGCRGRALPSMLVEPYVQQNNGKTGRALSSSEQSSTSPLLQNSALGLCDALFRLVRHIQNKWGRGVTAPTCLLGFGNDSDTGLNRRSNSDYQLLASKETVASELRQTAETFQVSDCRSLGSSLHTEQGYNPSSNTCGRSSWSGTSRRKSGTASPLASASVEQGLGIVCEDRERVGSGSTLESNTSSLAGTKAPQSQICKLGKRGFPASFSRMQRTCVSKTYAALSFGFRALRTLAAPVLYRKPDSVSSYIYYDISQAQMPHARLLELTCVDTCGEVVYNLGVEEDNSYFAGGIAVHNCDVWAAHDEGLGAGVYLPDAVPVDHPHGLCFQTTVLKEFPDVVPGSMTMKPDVAAVPESQVRYYAERLQDAPALALLAKL